MDSLEIILLSEATTGGGSMKRGYDTTARRPSIRYYLHLVLSLHMSIRQEIEDVVTVRHRTFDRTLFYAFVHRVNRQVQTDLVKTHNRTDNRAHGSADILSMCRTSTAVTH